VVAGMLHQSWVSALIGKASNAVQTITRVSPHGGQREQHCGCHCIWKF
jgi:hypothetical protein